MEAKWWQLYTFTAAISLVLYFTEKFDNIHPGDCIVCFSKNDIYYISRQLEMRGVQCAVIYGGLPPGKYMTS